MIKINLAQKKKAAALTVDASGLLNRIKAKFRSVSGNAQLTPQMKATLGMAAICAVLGYGASLAWDAQKAKELEGVRTEIAEVEAQVNRLNSELAKTQGYQSLKKKLEEDERAIRLKIETIEKLMIERRDPPEILKTLSQVTPKEIWLTDFAMRNADVKISGQSRGLAPVSDYMRTLESTIYFKEVALRKSTAKREQGIDIATFDLEAKRK